MNYDYSRLDKPYSTYKQHHKNQNLNPKSLYTVMHDDLYARAWYSEYETSTFDNGPHEPDNINSPKITVLHDLANDETCTIPGTIRESSPEISTQADEVDDGTDTDHYMEPDAETNSEQLSLKNVNHCSTNLVYAIILNRTVMMTTDK